MNRFIKAIFAILLLTAIPLKQWAQTPYRSYADEGIVLNFFEIDNYDFRLYLLYNIHQDERFVLMPEDENGLFILTPESDGQEEDFLGTFEAFYNNVSNEFRLIDKVFLQDLVTRWKASVPPTYFTSITMDLALNRAITLNNHCVDSDPFCTSDVIQFVAANTSQTADQLEGQDFDDGCIGSSYNPSWYHMRINTPGQFIIHMEGRDPDVSSIERDIDFCMWGPYLDPTVPCVSQLTTNKIIDCNYSSHFSEDIFLGFPENEHYHQADHGTVNYHMPETGEYYILMITNFSRQPCVITFTKTEGSGPGTTDCGILPGIAANDGPYCVGETIHLTVTTQAGATYTWTGPNGFTSNVQNPVIPNCTYEMGGTYTCVTAVDGQTTTGSTEVVIFPQPVADFNFTSVCEGEITQLTSTADTDPSGLEITNYYWDFGDGQTAEGATAAHTYASAGEYQVTHTVATGNGRCVDEVTKTVSVYAIPVATVSVSPSSVIYGGVATLTAIVDTPGNFTFHWEPANMVTNPNSQTTQTVPIQETQVFTVTITNTQGGCTSTIQGVVSMAGSNLTATATADQYEICEDASTTLHALPQNGTGYYTYSWTPAEWLSSTTVQHPVATPPVGTTTFTCTVGDGLTTQIVNVSIVVLPKDENEIAETVCNQFIWNPEGHTIVETDHPGNSYDASGSYYRIYANQYGCDSLVKLDLTVNYDHTNATQSYSSECDVIHFDWFGTITDLEENGVYTFNGETVNGCDSIMTVTVGNMAYSPQPSTIQAEEDAIVFALPENPNLPDTALAAAVVTSTEFFSFQYQFKVVETTHSQSEWNTCIWTISKPSWEIEFDPIPVKNADGMFESQCTVYVADRDEDYVVLSATVKNDCDSLTRRFYLKSSFLGVDEHSSMESAVSIVPNPNNGQMRINFEDMEGRTAIRVFDMTGNQIDAFETNISASRQSIDYTMKPYTEGIYLFVFANHNRVFTKKVVIIQ